MGSYITHNLHQKSSQIWISGTKIFVAAKVCMPHRYVSGIYIQDRSTSLNHHRSPPLPFLQPFSRWTLVSQLPQWISPEDNVNNGHMCFYK